MEGNSAEKDTSNWSSKTIPKIAITKLKNSGKHLGLEHVPSASEPLCLSSCASEFCFHEFQHKQRIIGNAEVRTRSCGLHNQGDNAFL